MILHLRLRLRVRMITSVRKWSDREALERHINSSPDLVYIEGTMMQRGKEPVAFAGTADKIGYRNSVIAREGGKEYGIGRTMDGGYRVY